MIIFYNKIVIYYKDENRNNYNILNINWKIINKFLIYLKIKY